MDQVFTLKQIMDNSIDQNLPLYMVFVDFKQAYDTVRREMLYSAMRKLGISNKLIRLVKMTLSGTEYKVMVNGEVSEKFQVGRGLRQGDPLSTSLFNIVLEATVRECEIKLKGTIYNQKVQIMAFADDIVILARTKNNLIEATKKLEKFANIQGLKINEKKTKYLIVEEGGNKNQEKKLEFVTEDGKQYSFDRVETFSYLGVTVTSKNEEKIEIDERIAKGNRCLGALRNMLRSSNLSRNTKIRIYQTVIRPIVTYGGELWKLNQREKETLEIWERKVLRTIFGGKKIGEYWTRRTNKELEEMYGHPSITNVVRVQRMRWLGHVARLSDNRPTKQVLTRGITGRRKRGRPRTKWIDAVEKDLEELGIENWKRLTGNKTEWRKICNQAMGLLGSKC